MSDSSLFGPCPICGREEWSIVHTGAVRDGSFGNYRVGASVGQCAGCGVQRLDEAHCLSADDYEGWEYRRKLGQTPDVSEHFRQHDPFQRRMIDHVLARVPRGRVVLDVGCAGGAFLDHVRGLAAKTIGIEPNREFHPALALRGIEVFPYTKDAIDALHESIDLAVSFQVIEHTTDPRAFLEDIRPLLRSKAELLLTTPNRRDILMDILPVEFRSFFYRTVHRWYFDAGSLAICAEQSGFKVEDVNFIHGYGLSNAMAWLRDRKPTGWTRLDGIDPALDAMWKAALERNGQSDMLMARLSIS